MVGKRLRFVEDRRRSCLLAKEKCREQTRARSYRRYLDQRWLIPIRDRALFALIPPATFPVDKVVEGRKVDDRFGPIRLRIKCRRHPVCSRRAFQVVECDAFRQAVNDNDDLVLYIDALKSIDILGLDHPTVACKHNLCIIYRGARDRRKKILSVLITLAAKIEPRIASDDLIERQWDLLKVASVIACRFYAPACQMLSDVHRSNIKAARGRIASLKLIGRDKGKPFFQLFCGYGFDISKAWRRLLGRLAGFLSIYRRCSGEHEHDEEKSNRSS